MALAAALLLALPGCGSGSDGDSTDSVHWISKAEFVKKGNAICDKGTKKMLELDTQAWKKYGRGNQRPSEAVMNKVALSMLPVREKELRLLRELGRPRGSGYYVDRMFAAWEEGIEKGRKEPSSLRAGSTEYAFYKTYSMGIDYGLTKCWLD